MGPAHRPGKAGSRILSDQYICTPVAFESRTIKVRSDILILNFIVLTEKQQPSSEFKNEQSKEELNSVKSKIL